MIKRLTIRFFIFTLIISSCSKKPTPNPLKKALNSKNNRITRVMNNLEKHEIQIRYTQINRKNDSVLFTDFNFQVNPDYYFYPSSSIKLPLAVAALEKLNEIDSLNSNTKFYIEGDTTETTFAKNITEVFTISDDKANNRLIEFLGFDAINKRIKKRNITPIQISHRLSTTNADDISTKPLILYINDSTTTSSKPIINLSSTAITIQKIRKGLGYYSEDSLYQEPFDFNLKNMYSLPAQHELLKRIIFPNNCTKKERFNLSNNQNQILLNAMRAVPKNAGYDSIKYYDSYRKFFIYGDSKESIPNYIEIYNTAGYAYGTITDSAYIKDTKNDIDFIVTATILVNDNGIFNDGIYEYNEIGIPFLAQLGRELYTIELERK